MQKIFDTFKNYLRKSDTFMYKGWLISDKFYKRIIAFSVYTIVSIILIQFLYIVVLYTIAYIQFNY